MKPCFRPRLTPCLLHEINRLFGLAGSWARFTVAALIQRLLHGANRSPAGQHTYAGALSSGTKGFHDIVTEKIGEKDEQLGTRRKLQGFFLVSGIAATNVVAYGNVVAFQEFGDIA